jgi:hypothetical protein
MGGSPVASEGSPKGTPYALPLQTSAQSSAAPRVAFGSVLQGIERDGVLPPDGNEPGATIEAICRTVVRELGPVGSGDVL